MDEEFFIYEVKKGESLSEIAGKIGITDEQLINFHNSNCNDFGLPWFYNFVGVQKIVIPKNYKNPQQLWKEISEKLPSKIIQKETFAEKYSVTEIFEQIGEERKEHDYHVEIKLKREKEEWITEVNQSEFLVNGLKPEKKSSSIGLSCMEAISPIPILLSNNGKMLNISRIEELEKLFENKRIEIEGFRSDEISKKYLDNFQKELKSDGNLFQQLRSTLLYQTIFPNFDWFWKKDKFSQDFFVLLNTFPVECEFAPYHLVDDSNIAINFFGKITEECTFQELIQNKRFDDEEKNNFVDGQVNLSYIYSTERKKIVDAEAVILLWNDEDLFYKHQIKITHNEK